MDSLQDNGQVIVTKEDMLWERLIEAGKEGKLPRHIAVIMDGNGRWAKKQGLERIQGHKAGVESVRRIIRHCRELGIPYLTLYTFSTENWKRPKEEVDALMNILVESLTADTHELIGNGIRIKTIGDLSSLPDRTRRVMEDTIQATAQNQELTLVVALNYGGRSEIIKATREICQAIQHNDLRIDEIDEEVFAKRLYTSDIPDPDLLIRTSGEMRISNFLLWQLAYTEIWITKVLWPDFDRNHFSLALEDYLNRDRRYGGIAPCQ